MNTRPSGIPSVCIALLAIAGLGLAGCASSGGSSGHDTSDTYPYLTADPAATSSTGTLSDGAQVTYTVSATGPMGLTVVSVGFDSIATGTGFPSLAATDLTESATGTWTGSATVDTSGGVYQSADYYLHIYLYTGDPYVSPYSAEGSDYQYNFDYSKSKYVIRRVNADGTENTAESYKTSKYKLVELSP